MSHFSRINQNCSEIVGNLKTFEGRGGGSHVQAVLVVKGNKKMG